MRFASLAFAGLALLSAFGTTDAIGHGHAVRQLRNNHQDGLPGFPRVYTAIVPERTKETTGENGHHFSAKVDLLGVVETGLPSPYDGTGTDYVKISFLVHDAKELARIEHTVAREPHDDSQKFAAWNANDLQLDATKTNDLHEQLDYTEPDYNERRKLQQFGTIPGYSCYKSLQGTFDFMDDIVDRVSNIDNLSASVEVIGASYRKTQNSNEGYDMKVLKLTGDSGRPTDKGVLFAMTGIHAREYTPPELVSRWIDFMVTSYSNGNPDIVSVLDQTEIHVVLQANPDGREVAESNRFLFRRKNLNPSSGNSNACGQGSYGVDLNRNFPFRYGLNSGSSDDPCDETFRGTGPASEPEVRAIVDYVSSIFPTDQRKASPEEQLDEPYPETAKGIFFDIHSSGEIIIWPWGHIDKETPNDSGLEAMVNKFRNFNGYGNSGPNGEGFLYPASGATDDWAYGGLGASSTTLELGTAFYERCNYFTDNILPQNLKTLTYAASVSRAPYSLTKGPDVTQIIVSSQTVPTSLTVTAQASDSAWSVDNHPTSRQQIASMRVLVDVHPDDLAAPDGAQMSGSFGTSTTTTGSLTIDVSGLSAGKHTVYVQAMDSAGYKGPVAAASFTKQLDTPVGNTPAPTPASTPAPTQASTQASTPGDTPVGCSDDMTSRFMVNIIGEERGCAWLQLNMARFDYLCQLIEVAHSCQTTCGACETFA